MEQDRNEEMKENDVNKEETKESSEIEVTIEDADEKKESEETKKEEKEKTDDLDSKEKSSNKNSSKKPRKTIKGLEMELKAQGEIIDELKKKYAAAKEANEQAQDKYQRLMAEFENMRKRTEKESTRMYDVGAKEVLEKLLPSVDNFERAQLTVTEEQKDESE